MKKFCLSYSSGKDCLLAMDRLIQAGNQPVALVATLSDEINRSWFHGIPISVLEAAAEALDLPLVISHNNETNYTEKVVEALQETKKLGAETVCFGDIDIEQNGAWDRQVALSAGESRSTCERILGKRVHSNYQNGQQRGRYSNKIFRRTVK